LALQELGARRDLVGLRVPVTRRPAFHDVGDVHLVPTPADRPDQPREELARLADERSALGVFVASRPLTDEHHLGRRVAFAGNGVRSAFVQATPRTGRDFARDGLERRLALGVGHTPLPPAPTGAGALSVSA